MVSKKTKAEKHRARLKRRRPNPLKGGVRVTYLPADHPESIFLRGVSHIFQGLVEIGLIRDLPARDLHTFDLPAGMVPLAGGGAGLANNRKRPADTPTACGFDISKN